MTRSHRPESKHTSRLLGLYGPVAVVTGASDGIGLACAEALAESGLDVVLVSRRREALETIAADLARRHGVRAFAVDADLGTDEGLARVRRETEALDVGLLVAAAGFGTSGPFLAADLEVERAMLRLNADATLALAHHFGQRFAARGRGGLVLFGSVVGTQGAPFAASYAATKAFVQSLGEALRVELAPRGVTVLVSAPGPVHSGFAARADMRMGEALTPSVVASGTLDALGRWGTVRPGWLSKLLAYALAMLPRFLRVHVMGLVMRGMTRHQSEMRVHGGTSRV